MRICTANLRVFIVILYSIFLLQGCSIFTTRTPEEPLGSGSSFQQPVTELIVVSNFTNAVSEKNTENFIACLSDSSVNARRPFRFEPSSEAGARFSEQFRTWTIQNERQAFFSMISRVPNGEVCSLSLNNGRFDVRVPDSAVYVAEYVLQVNHSSASIPRTASGTLRLTIVPNQLNQWSIERWADLKPSGDSLSTSWSILKAQFSN